MLLRPSRRLAGSVEQKRTNSSRSVRSAPLALLLLLFIAATLASTLGSREVSAQTVVAPPTFSVPHGLYSSSFTLYLTSASGAAIRYTTNGSPPTATVGTVYNNANGIPIDKTTVVRAVAYSGGVTSVIATQSYIYLANVRAQTNTPPAGWPDKFAPDDLGDDEAPGLSTYPADYEMDPQVLNSYSAGTFDTAMKSLPSMSIATDLPNLWDRDYGIYWNSSAKEGDPADTKFNNPVSPGKWERPISLEWIDPNGTSTGFSVNGGLRINGQASRRPHRTPKRSFRVYFKAGYGNGKLDFNMFDYGDAVAKFDRIVLRNGGNRSWPYFDRDQRREADYVNDEWARRAWLQMGNLAPHGTYVHLYINGIYWGLYNVTERIDEKFVQAYMGGLETDYSILEADEDLDDIATADPPETISAWNELLTLVSGSAAITNEQYSVIKTKVDIENLADYFVHVQYVGKTDWPHHNWNAYRKTTGPDTRFKFIPWDNDSGLNKVTENTTKFADAKGPDDAPSRVFLRLTSNAEFRQVLADRLYKHVLDPKGALTPTSCAALYTQLTGIIDQAIIGESARWGDYVRDAYPRNNATLLPKTFPAYLMSRDLPTQFTDPTNVYTDSQQKTWLDVRREKLEGYCPERSNVLRDQYVANGWYQNGVKPPVFSQFGGAVPAPYTLIISNTANNNAGDIYYTTDGVTDPRSEFGAVAPTATPGNDLVNLPISQVTTVKARVLNGAVWSPLVEYTFYPPQPFGDLVISEVHYNPVAPTDPLGENPDDYEFLELHNKGTTPLRLDNVSFARGMTFRFPLNTTISPGQSLVLASDATRFQTRYGFAPYGDYRGNLSNLGEAIEVVDGVGVQVDIVNYKTIAPWPSGANGGGGSLCLTDLALNNSLPASWKASIVRDGTPAAPGCDTPVTPQPIPTFDPASLHFGEQPVGQPSLAQVVTLRNTGSRTLNINSIVASSGFVRTTTCGANLEVSESCTMSVTFTPTAAGAITGSLTLVSNAPSSPHTVALTGVGVTGTRALTLSPDSVTFDTQAIGSSSAPKAVTLSNAGTLALDVSSITTSGDFAQTSDCVGNLLPGANCTINVTFAPTAVAERSGTLTVNSNAANTPHTLALAGVGGGGAADLTLSVASLTFEDQAVATSSAPQLVVISNSGTAPAAISSITTSGDFGQTNTCAASLGVGESCTVSVTFTPTVGGQRSGSVIVASDAPNAPHTVALAGVGLGGTPALTLSTTSLTFDEQLVATAGGAQSVVITNSGTAATSLSFTVSGDFAQTSDCAGSLIAGASCTVSVTFAPKSVGLQTGSLTINSNAPDSPHSVALTGTGSSSSYKLHLPIVRK